MKKLRTIVRLDEAERLAEAVKSGQMRLMQEVSDGRMQIIILTKSGAAQAIVGVKMEAIFRPILMDQGNEDGLFAGFSQTQGSP